LNRFDAQALRRFSIFFATNCHYCGAKPANVANSFTGKYEAKYSSDRAKDGYFIYNGLDRLNSSLPHDKNNVVSCCTTCNKAKLTMSVQEFLSWIQKVYNFNFGDSGT